MAVPAAAATLAGIASVGAYLDAKYHIRQDLRILRKKRNATKHYADLVENDRQSLWYSFATHVPKYPHELCIWSRDAQYTWQETHDQAIQWAQFFLAQGVKPGDMVGTYLMNSADFLVVWLGLWCIGCSPAMLNYHLKGDALVHCLRVSGVRLCLVDTDAECQSRYLESKERVEKELGIRSVVLDGALVGEVRRQGVLDPGDQCRRDVQGADPTCLLYTSGTTGLPKGGAYTVARYHERGAPDMLPFEQKAGPGGDRWYCSMPIFHGTGGLALMGALTWGCSVAVGRKFSVSTFWDDIADSEATIFVYVGEAARYLLMAPKHPRDRQHPRLRGMYGNGMRPDVWERFKTRFDVPQVMEFFNSTEGVLGMVIYSKGPFTANCVGQFGAILRRGLHDVLVPVQIDPETGAVVRDPKTGWAKRNTYNEGGEILVQVPSEKAFAGYYNNPAATSKKFERDVFKKGDLFYRSGDALRRDDDGRWFFLDRLGDTYRWKSENVSTAEVAEVLGRYPGVAEAIVYGVLVPKHDGRAGCVALRLDDGVSASAFDYRALLQYARSKLPKFAVPVFIRLVQVASNTDNQKQNKTPLREEGIELEKYGERVAGGATDVVLWTKPGLETYERFGSNELGMLRDGKLML